jgi:hypothetical protein
MLRNFNERTPRLQGSAEAATPVWLFHAHADVGMARCSIGILNIKKTLPAPRAILPPQGRPWRAAAFETLLSIAVVDGLIWR